MSGPLRLPETVAPLFTALERSPDPVFATDRRNRIVFWNRSAERVLGYTAEEVTGAGCAGVLQGCDVYSNRYCSDVCPVTQMAVRSEVIRHFDRRLRAKDGRLVAVDVSILTFVVGADDFLLAHVLKPVEAPSPRPAVEAEAAPPRLTLVTARTSPDARARSLTEREVEVLGMLAAGHPTPEIASRLHISNLTARNHIQNILDKLEVHSKAEAVAFAFQKRLI